MMRTRGLDMLVSKAKQTKQCTICLGPLRAWGILPCGHTFCFTCIQTWSQRDNRCPLCKRRFYHIRDGENFQYGVEHADFRATVLESGCVVCKSKDNEEVTLLCDSCEDPYHTYCLTPKLSKIPEGEWRCPRCILRAQMPQDGDLDFASSVFPTQLGESPAAAPSPSPLRRMSKSESAAPVACEPLEEEEEKSSRPRVRRIPRKRESKVRGKTSRPTMERKITPGTSGSRRASSSSRRPDAPESSSSSSRVSRVVSPSLSSKASPSKSTLPHPPSSSSSVVAHPSNSKLSASRSSSARAKPIKAKKRAGTGRGRIGAKSKTSSFSFLGTVPFIPDWLADAMAEPKNEPSRKNKRQRDFTPPPSPKRQAVGVSCMYKGRCAAEGGLGSKMKPVPADDQFCKAIGKSCSDWKPSWAVCKHHFNLVLPQFQGTSSVNRKARVLTLGREWRVEIKAETKDMFFVQFAGYQSRWNEWVPKEALLELESKEEAGKELRVPRVKTLTDSEPVWRYCFGVVGRGAELGPSGDGPQRMVRV